MQPLALKRFRLDDGTPGTEYEACKERLATLEAKRLALDERIELLRHMMETAEGHP